VLKEALANAVTHAGASRVDVTLAVQGQRLRLNVRDDGIGFTPGAPGGPIEGKDGLGNMQRRADELGATLRIESAPGRGTEVLVELPL
jgi:signal transduction histidine kinase